MNIKAIEDILLYDWDPIGISDVTAARNEYRSYAIALAPLLAQPKQKIDLVQFLLSIERTAMGLPGNERRAQIAAEKLMQLG